MLRKRKVWWSCTVITIIVITVITAILTSRG